MVRNWTVRRFWVLATVVALMSSACSTPQSRAKEKEAVFSSLSPQEQNLVLQGKIEEGMSPDAVYIAMGRPSRVTQGQMQKQQITRWIYGQARTEFLPSCQFRTVVLPNGRVFLDPVLQPDTVTVWVDTFAVIFQNGRVIGWEDL